MIVKKKKQVIAKNSWVGGRGASGTAYEINHLLYSKVISVLQKEKKYIKTGPTSIYI